MRAATLALVALSCAAAPPVPLTPERALCYANADQARRNRGKR